MRATNRGHEFVKTDEIYNLSIQRATILFSILSTKNNQWTEWKTINHALSSLVESAQSDVDKHRFEKYSNDVSRVVSDVCYLENLSLIECARYRAPNGQLLKEKPLGMTHR